MRYAANGLVHNIEECFRQWGEIVSNPALVQWSIVSPDVPALSLRAHLIDNRLQICADICPVTIRAQIWTALKLNSRLDGAARFFLDAAGRSIGVRAEIPLDDEVDIAPDLIATLAGFKSAASLFLSSPSHECHAATGSVCATSTPELALSLRQLLSETDWPYIERAGGICAVELDSKGDFCQALLVTESDGNRRISIELAAWDAPASASRDALAVLLLTASGVMRFIRPVGEDFGDRITARFEMCIPPDANSALLVRGLSSLSVACRLCGREAAVLNNARIAEEYLTIRAFTIE